MSIINRIVVHGAISSASPYFQYRFEGPLQHVKSIEVLDVIMNPHTSSENYPIVISCDEVEIAISKQSTETKGVAVIYLHETTREHKLVALTEPSSFAYILPRIDRLTFRFACINPLTSINFQGNTFVTIILRVIFYRKIFDHEATVGFLNPHIQKEFIHDLDAAREIEGENFSTLIANKYFNS